MKGPADAAALNGTCGSVGVNRRDSHLPGVRAATAGTLGVAGRAGLSKCPDKRSWLVAPGSPRMTLLSSHLSLSPLSLFPLRACGQDFKNIEVPFGHCLYLSWRQATLGT